MQWLRLGMLVGGVLVGWVGLGKLAAAGDVVVDIDVATEASGSVVSATDVEVMAEGGTVTTEVSVNGEEVVVEQVGDERVVSVGGESVSGEAGVVEVETAGGTQVRVDAQAGAATVAVRSGRVAAVTDLPVSTDETGRVLVQVGDQEWEVRWLIDEVVERLEETGAVDRVVGVGRLVEVAGVPVYKVEGERVQSLWGLVPVRTTVQVHVSAEDGGIVEQETMGLGRLLAWFIE